MLFLVSFCLLDGNTEPESIARCHMLCLLLLPGRVGEHERDVLWQHMKCGFFENSVHLQEPCQCMANCCLNCCITTGYWIIFIWMQAVEFATTQCLVFWDFVYRRWWCAQGFLCSSPLASVYRQYTPYFWFSLAGSKDHTNLKDSDSLSYSVLLS